MRSPVKSPRLRGSIKTAGWLLVLASLSGCSVFYTPGMSELRELCQKDGGMPVYEYIEAEGYFDTTQESCGCYIEIVDQGFKFLEVEVKKVYSSDQILEPGFWRIERVERESGKCNTKFDKRLNRFNGSGSYDSFLERYCIYTEKIETPKSQYRFEKSVEQKTVSEFYGSTIDRIELMLIENHTDRKVVSKVMYLLNPWPNSALSYGKVYRCSHFENVDYERIISPKK